ncbi:MAG: acylphosphatase [Ignavibacteriae bacterium]|nr:acylphosphatase [Ignavibacteriota bacterium]MCB9206778.1 acylphosphatase [Ignavibacteriales bacterium]MCB9210214.1 acylphosphatase [Ignavibacteriales bacterium]MCB9259594.1 acylphosphatase [Ignavibacteriales bacterium]
MQSNRIRAEIIVYGLVQGVGFRYFVLRKAQELGLVGYTKNQYDGTVLTIAEGEKHLVEEFFHQLKIGPMHSDVRDIKISWQSFVGEFTNFEIRRY